MTYADYTCRLHPVDLTAAGVSGVFRYLSWLNWWGGQSHPYPNPKVIQPAEYRELTAGGIDVFLNWEYDAHDWLDGASGGSAHGIEAVAQAKALGYPLGKPLPGSADFNMTLAEWNGAGKPYAVEYAKPVMDAGYLPGVYGPYDVLEWVSQEVPEYRFFWQAGMSTSWSGGRNAGIHPAAHFRQVRAGTIAGQSVDFNEVLRPYGGTMAVTLEDVANLLKVAVENDSTLQADGTHKPILAADGSQLAAGNGVKQELDEIRELLLTKASGLSDAQYADLKAAVLAQTSPDAIVSALLQKVAAVKTA